MNVVPSCIGLPLAVMVHLKVGQYTRRDREEGPGLAAVWRSGQWKLNHTQSMSSVCGLENQAHPGKEMITTCQIDALCSAPIPKACRFGHCQRVVPWHPPATIGHASTQDGHQQTAGRFCSTDASLRIAEESAPSRACQWHPQTWQVGRRSSVRLLGLRPDTQYKLLLAAWPLSPVYTSTVEVPSSFSCRRAGAVWRSTPSVWKSLQQGVGSGRSAASRAGWRRAAESRSTRCQ